MKVRVVDSPSPSLVFGLLTAPFRSYEAAKAAHDLEQKRLQEEAAYHTPVEITDADVTLDGLHVAFGRSIDRPSGFQPPEEEGGPRGGGFPGFAGWQDFGGDDDDEGDDGSEGNLGVRCLALKRGERPQGATSVNTAGANAGTAASATNASANAGTNSNKVDTAAPPAVQGGGVATEGDAFAVGYGANKEGGLVTFDATKSAPLPPDLPGGQLLLYTGDDAGVVLPSV